MSAKFFVILNLVLILESIFRLSIDVFAWSVLNKGNDNKSLVEDLAQRSCAVEIR